MDTEIRRKTGTEGHGGTAGAWETGEFSRLETIAPFHSAISRDEASSAGQIGGLVGYNHKKGSLTIPW
jgi:hypothetical protein